MWELGRGGREREEGRLREGICVVYVSFMFSRSALLFSYICSDLRLLIWLGLWGMNWCCCGMWDGCLMGSWMGKGGERGGGLLSE